MGQILQDSRPFIWKREEKLVIYIPRNTLYQAEYVRYLLVLNLGILQSKLTFSEITRLKNNTFLNMHIKSFSRINTQSIKKQNANRYRFTSAQNSFYKNVSEGYIIYVCACENIAHILLFAYPDNRVNNKKHISYYNHPNHQ